MAEDTIDISFFVPCYNEEDNIVPTIETISRAMTGRPWSSEILVYDDGSSDRTPENVEAYGSAHPETRLRLFRNNRNRGLGINYLRGAFEAHGTYYLMVCGDHDTPLETLQQLLDMLGRADMIIPYVGNMEERPWLRRLVSKTFTSLVGLISRTHLQYYNGMVIHRTETVRSFRPKAAGFAYQAEILCQAVAKGLSYIEIPLRTVPQKGALQTSAFRASNMISVLGSLWRITWNPRYHKPRRSSRLKKDTR